MGPALTRGVLSYYPRVPLLVFAYGSLIFRPSPFFGERRAAAVRGFRRAFRQGSPDHRGTPGFPGRVVTLLREEGALCGGALYEVDDAHVGEALVELDNRESGGYDRFEVMVEVRGAHGPVHVVQALTWIAGPDNPNHLPPAPLQDVAEVVRRARGKSGANVDYVVRLAAALRCLGWSDPEVFALEAAVAD